MLKIDVLNKLVPPLVIAFVTAFAFSRILTHDFIHLDDRLHIYGNPMLSPVSPSHLILLWRKPFESLYIPISYMVFAGLSLLAHTSISNPALTDTGAALDPRVFHAASLLLHVANAVLVYFLLKKLVGQTIPTTLGALVWSLHPVQVESVAWASELRGLLSAFFCLLALLNYPFGKDDASMKGAAPSLMRTVALGVLGMLCKPSAVTIPLAALCIDLFVFKAQVRPALIRVGIWLACLAPFALLTGSAQTVRLPGPLYEPPIYLRPIIALDAIGFYITKLVPLVPLCTDYGRTPEFVLHSTSTILDCLLALLFLLSMIFTCRRSPIIFGAQLIFLTALLPVLGLVPFIFQYFSTVSDRYLYIAMVGPALACAWIIAERKLFALQLGLGLFCIVLAAASWIQTGYWKNTDIFAQHILEVNRNSAAAAKLLGDDETARGDFVDAAVNYQREIESAPLDFRGYSDLGLIKLDTGSVNEALPLFIKAAEMRPDISMNRGNVGAAYLVLGQFDKADVEFSAAERLAPSAALPQYQLAQLDLAKHDNQSAIFHLQRAIELEPQFVKSYPVLASIYIRQKRPADALAVYLKQAHIDPTSAVALYNAGIMLNVLGRTDEAAGFFQRAIAIAPNYSAAHLQYGIVLGQRGNLSGAISQFQAAIAADPANQAARQDLQLAVNSQR